jgi:hypothetical protein
MKKIHPAALGNALIWVAVILAAALLLRGTEYAATLIAILGGGAGTSILVVGNALSTE